MRRQQCVNLQAVEPVWCGFDSGMDQHTRLMRVSDDLFDDIACPYNLTSSWFLMVAAASSDGDGLCYSAARAPSIDAVMELMARRQSLILDIPVSCHATT